MRLHTAVGFSALSLGQTYCSPAPTATPTPSPALAELSGSVFIVTAGGPSIKLGLVTVSAIPSATVHSHITSKKKVADSLVATLPAQKPREAQYLQLEANIANTLQWSQLSASGKITYLRSPRFYFEGLPAGIAPDGEFSLPTGIATAKTDADGRFTLRFPRQGSFVLAARASRVTGDRYGYGEHYFWLVPFAFRGEPSATIMLSNDNMVGLGADWLQSFVK